MSVTPDLRCSGPGRATVPRTVLAVLAAGALLLSACGDDDAADAGAESPQTGETTTTAAAPADDGGDDDSSSTTLADPEPIVGEFQAVEAGRRTIDTLGIPLVLELTGEWWVQPNHTGVTVLTHPESRGPADRDVVFFRPSGLVEPDRVNDSPEGFRSQEGWPLSDIDGWLGRVLPGLVDSDPIDTTLGGRDAVRFDIEPAEDFPCGPEVCAGFITNEWVDTTFFEPGKRRTIWWVDGAAHDPLVVLVGRNADDTDWLNTAEALLDTVELGEPRPRPTVDQHPALVGTWTVPGSGRTQTFTADGEHSVSQDGEVLAEGTWTSTSTTIEIVPGSGPIACAQAGTYEWEIENDTLTLTAVDDQCADRKAGLDGVPRERVR